MKFKGVSSFKRMRPRHDAIGKFYVSMKTLTFSFSEENVTTLTLHSQPKLSMKGLMGWDNVLGLKTHLVSKLEDCL
jgi:hypothetical protein